MRRILAAASVLAAMSTALVVGGPQASSGAATKATIKIGFISSLTGDASSTYVDTPGGAQAVIDAANAKGGVNGHKLQLIVKSDSSTSTANETAAKELISDGVTVIIDDSSFAFGGAPYLAQQHFPVVGAAFDGPEWDEKGFTNMFTWAPPITGEINGKYYTTTAIGEFLKKLGVTSFGGLGYAISPAARDAILAAERSASDVGIKTCYTNNTVAFGDVDFTTDALQIKAADCGAISSAFVESSDLALSTAMKSAGLTKVLRVFFTGYAPTTTATKTNIAAMEGAYAEGTENFTPPNAGGQKLLDILKKYDPGYKGGVLNYGLITSTVSTQLTVYGLSIAGSNPTSASFMKNLRKVNAWTDTGFLATTAKFTDFGTVTMIPSKECAYFEHLVGSSWKATEVCGKVIQMPTPTTTG